VQEDFFIVLHNILKSRPEISEIHCVKDSKVPLMRFTFDGISVDLPYAQLKVLNVPEVSMHTLDLNRFYVDETFF
jgi:poly(A) polymerase